jgi:hypothetical protein
MRTHSVDDIFKNKLNIDKNLLEPRQIKKLYVTKDNKIIDNQQLSTNFVKDILNRRNEYVMTWSTTSPQPCKFYINIYHPKTNKKFLKFVSICKFMINNNSNLEIYYIDYINSNNKDSLIRINMIQPFLFYLKNNGLISKITFEIGQMTNSMEINVDEYTSMNTDVDTDVNEYMNDSNEEIMVDNE